MPSPFERGGQGSRLDDDRWTLLGASVAGASHRRRGTPCQDAHAIRVSGAGLVIAVADGLGSCERSAVGSASAVATFVELARLGVDMGSPSTLAGWRQLMLEAHQVAVERISLAADAEGRPVNDFATTLLGVVITPTLVISLQIGDGAIIIDDDDGCRSLPATPSGEFANQTATVLSPSAAADAVICVQHSMSVRRVAVLTDGLERLATDTRTRMPSTRFFDPFWNGAQSGLSGVELGSWMGSERVASSADDDLTLVVAARQEPR